MKPIIGIVPLVDETKDSFWMLPGYMNGVAEAGGIPVMLPLTSDKEEIRQLLATVQGILLTGGHDVDPAVYGEIPIPECGAFCRERDAMESELLKQALEKDLPVLGICRGIQFLNACLGGTLYQDLPRQYPSDTEHHQNHLRSTGSEQIHRRHDGAAYSVFGQECRINSLRCLKHCIDYC